MKRKSSNDGMSMFQRTPFSTLVKENSELAAIRRDYASRSAGKRRMAADWQYHSEMAAEIFNSAIAMSGKEGFGKPFWPPAVVALAIDPLYAPAIVTVGSIEYQLGRKEEAMHLFLLLTKLPKDEEDIVIIIDKAGDFLIDHDDYENALALYTAAEKACPRETVYIGGAGYCHGKLGHYEEAVEKHRRVNALEPDNYKHLNDLGYSLFEAGKLDEAEEVLRRSISLAPVEYRYPHNNLNTLLKKKKRRIASP
jgi:tetratricopeptide (TPR) repeat protein